MDFLVLQLDGPAPKGASLISLHRRQSLPSGVFSTKECFCDNRQHLRAPLLVATND